MIQATKRLGWEFKENQHTFKQYQSPEVCNHAIKVPGATYEIGVIKVGNEFTLKYDPYSAGGLLPAIGDKDCSCWTPNH